METERAERILGSAQTMNLAIFTFYGNSTGRESVIIDSIQTK